MLVLRRRARESIVFEGGLVVTLVEVGQHRAWLSFAAPSIPRPVVLSAVASGPGDVTIGIRSPASIRREGPTDLVELATSAEDGGGDVPPVLLLTKRAGGRVELPGVDLEVREVDDGRVMLAASVAEVAGRVGISIYSVSSSEAKFGILAPEDVRVYRGEVWQAMQRANEAAAGWSAADIATLARSPAERQR